MKKLLLLWIGLLCLSSASFAQNRTITGTVVDSAGAGLAQVSVSVVGTRLGTVTNSRGEFSLRVPASANRLRFSLVGYDALEVRIPKDDRVNITLSQISVNLNEVVVTAMGIRREKRGLGYSVSTVNKKDLEQRPEGDIARVLNGKVAGVNVLNTSGLSGSGTNIIIRGVSSITGSATPLFVVDGVPFNAATNAQSDFRYGNQTSSRFLDIDPNSIESIDVLKGLSATTLYGEQGRNGVVLITTKNGTAGKRSNRKSEVTVDQSFFLNNVANLPEYQKTWGGGIDLVATQAFSNFGARITNPVTQIPHPYDQTALNAAFPEFKGAMYDYKFYNSVKNFYRTGTVSSTSINFAGTGGNVNYNMNYGFLRDIGFTPGNSVGRHNFGLGGSSKLNNGLEISGTLNFSKTDFKSPPTGYSTGSGAINGSSAFGDLFYTPVTIDLMGLPYQDPITGGTVYYRTDNAIQNPRWTVANSFVRQDVNRFFGTAQLKYPITNKLNVTYRLGYDTYSENHTQAQNKGGVDGNVTGFYRTITGTNSILDNTALINFGTDINDNLSITVDAGANARRDKYTQTGVSSLQQLVFGLLDHSNFVSQSSTGDAGVDLDFMAEQLNVGLFAQTQLNYKDYLYLNVGARNTWTSVLEKGNNSLFYPSASVSFIPTSAFAGLTGNQTLNYLKLRFGYSSSAAFPVPFTTRGVLDINSNTFLTLGGAVINTNSINSRAPNPDLKPELISEIEGGIEAKLFNNRVSIDLTLYRRSSHDQILRQTLDDATGYDERFFNAGSLSNKGIELGVGYNIIRTKDFSWQLDGNFTLNRSKVYDMPEEIEQIVLSGFTSRGTIAKNGHPLGVIFGSYINRESKTGQRIVDQTTGLYQVSSDQKIIGDPTPDYRLVGISTLTYKTFSFRMQWDYTRGGDMFAITPHTLVARGVTKDTDFDRTLPLIYPGVDPNGNPNTFQLSSVNAFFDGSLNADEQFVYDASVVRLREASLTFSFPQRLLEKLPFGGVSFSVIGQNLWYKAPNFPRYTNFDPETTSLGVGGRSRGFEYATAPSSRRIGASLRITF